jgi:hypothetical protein
MNLGRVSFVPRSVQTGFSTSMSMPNQSLYQSNGGMPDLYSSMGGMSNMNGMPGMPALNQAPMGSGNPQFDELAA